NLEIEILLYAACDRQIENAIKKVGIKKGKNEIGIVIIGSCKPGRIIKELGLEKNEKVFKSKNEKKIAKKYGINNNEMKIASIEKLILEKMAIMGLEI
ncbi:MAG: KEOPS complex subunit Cgi121, partial [Candidatus Thermoplasmatota archaeon]